jgi:hypothetical protein
MLTIQTQDLVRRLQDGRSADDVSVWSNPVEVPKAIETRLAGDSIHQGEKLSQENEVTPLGIVGLNLVLGPQVVIRQPLNEWIGR